MRATGHMKKNLKNYLESIPGNPSAQEVQTAATKGTVTILKIAPGMGPIAPSKKEV